MLQASKITKHFGGDTILDGIDLELNPGERVALVGPNGAGKSTLLRILLGELEPDAGKVHLLSGATVAYLPQDAGVVPGRTLHDEMLALFADVIELDDRQRELEAEMVGLPPESPRLMELVNTQAELHSEFERRGGYTLEAEIGRVLYGLGFSMSDYDKRVENFSGGWQMRIALARLLLQRPDLLLLDEPTNHLDLRATEWLEGFLRQYRGAVMVVSHDRYFLDLVATRTLELHRCHLIVYPGNYSFYVKEKARRQKEQEAAFKRQQDYLQRQQAFIARFGADKRRSSQTQSREKLLEKLERIEAPSGVQKAIKFRFPPSTPSGRKVFELRGTGKAYDDRWVFHGSDLLVEKGDRVALVGPNGAGKSTLLRLLAAVEKPDEGTVSVGANVLRAYYAQDQSESLDVTNTVLQELYTAAPKDWTLEDVRSMLGRFLFSGDDVYKSISVLSGGERSRLALAKMLLRASNVLLMDEPTNHLDIAARETLEDALTEYHGTLILASHDRYLIDKLANKVVEIDGGTVTLYPGNYTAYRTAKAQEAETAGRGDAETRRNGESPLPLGEGSTRRSAPSTSVKNPELSTSGPSIPSGSTPITERAGNGGAGDHRPGAA
ncbi:MAG TPA: ABC-F family ATP-binding cassette domain-containing protein, partial [Chloroflexota bacterium]|nr:ABC-F family ATP-binding cassette domain-containing protein [Chloroflexota bacterium]